jgi:Flp pilus assembly protein TadG
MSGERRYRPNCCGRGSGFYGLASATGSVSIGRGRLVGHKHSFITDRRGAVAFEMLIVFLFLGLGLLLPLADVAVAGLQYISAWEALRGFGQSIQYATPPDVTNASAWTKSALAKADPRFPIPSIQLICGDSNAACSASNTSSPKYYSYTTSVTLAPTVLRAALCTSGNADPCTFTLSYSERFQ